MAVGEIDTAILFTPGRASYVTSTEDGFALNLTKASQHRADTAASIFDENFHTQALFAGGYPGVAEHWPDEHKPADGVSEAVLMSLPLQRRLRVRGWDASLIASYVQQQGASNNSIGDVAQSMAAGYLDPNWFNSDSNRHGINTVAGRLHGYRFKLILSKALGIDPALIKRAPIYDIYGRPATEFRKAEPKAVAVAKEFAAIGLTIIVLKDVVTGDVDSLLEAEQRFNSLAGADK